MPKTKETASSRKTRTTRKHLKEKNDRQKIGRAQNEAYQATRKAGKSVYQAADSQTRALKNGSAVWSKKEHGLNTKVSSKAQQKTNIRGRSAASSLRRKRK